MPELVLIEDAAVRRSVVFAWDKALREHGLTVEDLGRIPFCADVSSERASLLSHLRAVARTAAHLADEFSKTYNLSIEKDALVAAALLHDVGKLDERKNPLLEHSLSSLLRAKEAGLPLKVLHAIAFHSEATATKRSCIEAELLYFADFVHYKPLLMEGRDGQKSSSS